MRQCRHESGQYLIVFGWFEQGGVPPVRKGDNISNADSIASIEAEWELNTSFLWKARQGQFDPVAFERPYKKPLVELGDR